MRDAWRLALGTFTALPVAMPSHVDRRVLGRAMLLAPLTTGPACLVWAALGWAAVHGWVPTGVAAVLALVVTALLSRALHLDGLADLADGLTSGHDRERSLAVMRRGDTGPAGAAAIVLALLLQAACLASLFASTTGTALAVVALVASRLACAVCTRDGIPPAREEGLGQGVAGTVGRAGLVGLVAVVVVVAAQGVGVATWAGSGQAGWRAVTGAALVVLAAVAAAVATRRHAVRRLGGVTGDVIGAAIEVALSAAAVTATLVTATLVT